MKVPVGLCTGIAFILLPTGTCTVEHEGSNQAEPIGTVSVLVQELGEVPLMNKYSRSGGCAEVPLGVCEYHVTLISLLSGQSVVQTEARGADHVTTETPRARALVQLTCRENANEIRF